MASLLVAAGCDGAEQAGTDTGNPVLTALVVDGAGQKVSNAEVIVYTFVQDSAILRRTTEETGMAVDTLWTDENGVARWEAGKFRYVGLEVYAGDSLGAWTRVDLDGAQAPAANVTVVPLVKFNLPGTPGTVVGTVGATGRVLVAGGTVALPPGLWNIAYYRYGLGEPDTLPALQVQVDDARQVPAALSGLARAAQVLDSLGVIPLGYAALSAVPSISWINAHLLQKCQEGGFNMASCNGNCRIWQWESDWVLAEDQTKTVLVGVLTDENDVHCVFFPEEVVGEDVELGYMHSLSEVVGP